MKVLFTLVSTLLCIATWAADKQWPPSESKGKLKVYILAGQSNMEGRGFPQPITWQVTQDEYRNRWTHLVKDGDFDAFVKKFKETSDPEDNRNLDAEYLWSTRGDVWINYLGKWGELTNGYGAPQNGFGPELNFGHVMGDHHDEQVLLIKASWGGRALARGFLPPSSQKNDAAYAEECKQVNAENEVWNKEQKAKVEEFNAGLEARNAELKAKGKKLQKPKKFKPRPIHTEEEYRAQWGKDYRNMVAEVHGCLGALKERFPGYQDQGYEIMGFVWFQGWNDQYNDRWLSYETNMAHFIRDVRKEFKAPDMKFVIGQMGHDGHDKVSPPDSPRGIIMAAQAGVPKMPEFNGNAVCVDTRPYWDKEAYAIYNGPGGWSKDVKKWRQFGNDRGYHYLGSPWFFAQAGTGFGEAMLKLLKK